MCARVCVSFLSYQRLDARQLRPADSPGRHAAVGRSTAAPRTTCACCGAHHGALCSPTATPCGAPLVSPASLQHLGLLGTASVWAAHRFNDRQVWSCSSCCRRNLSAAYSHYQQPCVKEPSVDNFREAMHGDAARTAALLLMIACSTDAPAATMYPLPRLARLEMGARRSSCGTVHRLRRRVCAPQDTEMLPASNFVCEFGECVRRTQARYMHPARPPLRH